MSYKLFNSLGRDENKRFEWLFKLFMNQIGREKR